MIDLDKYHFPDPTRERLRERGFRELSEGLYSAKCSLIKWNGITTLYGRIIVELETGNIRADVLQENNSVYHPYYNRKYGFKDNSVANYCEIKLKRCLSNYGIVKKSKRKNKE